MTKSSNDTISYEMYGAYLQECVEILEKDHFPIPRFLQENDDGSLDFMIHYQEYVIPETSASNGYIIQMVFNVSGLEGVFNRIDFIAISDKEDGSDTISLVSQKHFPKGFNMFEDNTPLINAYHKFKNQIKAFSLAS